MIAKYRQILETIPEPDRGLAVLNVNRQMNMVPGQRPSDCARDEVRTYERLGSEAYQQQFNDSRKEVS